MLSEVNLQELIAFQAEQPVLSVYLNVDPTLGNADAYRLELRNLLKKVDLPDDVAAVENFFSREYDWSGKSVAVFSCAPQGFFRAYSLAIPVPSRVRTGFQPHVKPLVNLLDYYGGYGVVLVDKQGARLFSFHLGELSEQEGIVGEEIRHVKHGGASAMAGRRGGMAGQTNYTDEAAERNMREAANFAAHFLTENNVRRVLIGGTDENVALFRNLLPKSWQSLIVGTFPMGMTASAEDVMARAMEIGQQAELSREKEIISKIITAAAKGRGGVLGLEDTLRALHERRIQVLAIQEGYRAPGYRCQGCGYLTAQAAQACAYCGAALEQIPDAVEMAVHDLMHTGGEVDILHHPSPETGFKAIGALLRY